MTREELIQSVKSIGQELIDTADKIVPDIEYMRDITINCYPTEKYFNVDIDIWNIRN